MPSGRMLRKLRHGRLDREESLTTRVRYADAWRFQEDAVYTSDAKPKRKSPRKSTKKQAKAKSTTKGDR